jgi:ATP-dependent DNA helicase RecG
VGNLLEYAPRRHLYFEDVRPIAEIRKGETLAIVGRVATSEFRPWGRAPSLIAEVKDETGRCLVRWFHGGRLRDRLRNDQRVWLHGKVSAYRGRLQLVNPTLQFLDQSELAVADQGQASYPATLELPSDRIARIIRDNLETMLDLVLEWIPEALLRRRRQVDLRTALHDIHVPATDRAYQKARRRLAYDEFMILALSVKGRKERQKILEPRVSLRCNREIDRRIRRRFPFKLTKAQDFVIGEITEDFNSGRLMHRLLQGDVGSGKTVVALYAALVAVAGGRQAAIMAPTEVLARQHHERIEAYLNGSRVRRALLTGGLKPKERDDCCRRIANGEVDLAVGTHALLEERVEFDKLAVVIVDEQHKFGVRQRARIRNKGPSPHYLVMTATPIPRSLALTVFGDLDVSIIDERPPGRGEVVTRLTSSDCDAYTEIKSRIRQGERAFIVYPQVQESADRDIKAAIEEAERLTATVFRGCRLGLIHGRMSSAEKKSVMDDFRAGRVEVLIATTVVEVGVDVPEATVMLIEHADRFGIAQLHQLRGRIGRGDRPGLCLLRSRSKNSLALSRLELLCEESDGFRLAAADLQLRGPGELLGARQHGIPELKIASLVDDTDLLEQAHEDASWILNTRDSFDSATWERFRSQLRRRLAGRFELIAAG